MDYKTLTFAASIKADGETNGIGKIKGYGSVFGVVDSYNEVCKMGCFARSLKENGMPAMLIQHSPWDVGGMWVKASEDETGLLLEGDINLEVQKGREAYALAKQGALKGLSIGFRTRQWEVDKENIKYLTDVDLLEVSIVTFPANPAAQISAVKSAMPRTEREFENFLRAGGFSRNQAKSIVSGGFKSLDRDDLEETLKPEDVRDAQIKAQIETIVQTFKRSIKCQ